MAREAVVRKVVESPVGGDVAVPVFGGSEPPGPPVVEPELIVSNARLALLMFLGAEAMFFSGLIGAFIVFRISSPAWPPPFQPRLPVGVTGVNTVILLLSGVAMRFAVRAAREEKSAPLLKWLLTAALLGTAFLGVQGYEWLQLIHYGLKLSSGVYGSTFYTLIGCHGVHVIGAVLWLIVVLARAWRGGSLHGDYAAVQLCGMYWTFVVGLWPILYGFVYLY